MKARAPQQAREDFSSLENPHLRKPIKRNKLTSYKIKLIIAAVVEEKLAYKEVAAKYSMTVALVGKLVRGKKLAMVLSTN